MVMVRGDAIQQLIDTKAIEALQASYARAVDRLDLESLRLVYHPDAYDDHGDYRGGVEGLLDYVVDRLSDATQVMHFLGQCTVEFASDTVAAAETYFMTAHTLGPKAQRAFGAGKGDAAVQVSMFGRYVDKVEKRADEWRIAKRTCVFESTRLYTDQVPPIKPEWAQLQRDVNDPIFVLRTELGIGSGRQ
jgi:hypothetical protein